MKKITLSRAASGKSCIILVDQWTTGVRDAWEDIYKSALRGEQWAVRKQQRVLKELGGWPDPEDGVWDI